MNSIDFTPLYRSSIGYDRLASLLDSALTSETNTNGYPPYNIEVIEENRYSIELAIAGFSQDDIDIQVEKGVLTICGKKSDNKGSKYLHKGIANRNFERKFNLADHVEVTGADLVNGLLTIGLVKEVPEAMKPKSIPINSKDNVLEHNSAEVGKGNQAA